MEELVDDLVAETRELLETLDGDIAAWEAEPLDRGRLDAMFRCFHTLKASSALFGLAQVEALAHAAEEALADVRSGRRAADRALVKEVRASARRIGELVEELRAEEPEGLFARLRRMVDQLAAQLGKEVLLEVEGRDADLPATLAGPLVHLVRNAVDHGIEPPEERLRARKNPAGRLRISVRRIVEKAVVELAEDGRGIDGDAVVASAVAAGLMDGRETGWLSQAGRAALVFEPGLSTASDVTAVSGRGVGMDAVRAAVERLGGVVEIESRRGFGTKIAMRVPLAQMRCEGPSCLIVDDSRVMRKVARQLLESLGYAVGEAEHGREALARIDAAMPDLILLDWNMPQMNGLEFLRRLRNGGYPVQPQVLICTGASSAGQIRAALAAGADGHIAKPLYRETLAAKLRMPEPSRLRRRAA